METIAKRPRSVTVIGWISIVFAVSTILSNGWGIWEGSQGQIEVTPIPSEIPAAWVFKLVVENYGILRYLGLALAMLILIAGIEFLRLRAWARTVLEIYYWFGFVLLIGVFSFILIWGSIILFPETLGMGSFFVASLITAIIAVPNLMIIFHLRSEVIRQAVTRI